MRAAHHELGTWGGVTIAFCCIAALATGSEVLAGLAAIAVVLTLVAVVVE